MNSEQWRVYADVGNTALNWAAHDGDDWIAEGRVGVEELTAGSAVVRETLESAGLAPSDCLRVALVSSRPSVADEMVAALAEATGAEVALMGRDLQARVEVGYYDPAEFGQDRLAAAEGALALHGAPAVVITLGTCITAQALDRSGRVVGGAIAAGMEAQAAGIEAAVPHLREPVEHALANLRAGRAIPGAGHSTIENLTLGLAASLRGTVEALVEAMGEVTPAPAPVIATGGDLPAARAAGVGFDHEEPLLILEGLRAVDERR
ncbi:MAG: type III pantothenate kinase [Armatimonadota bacterium]|nr:type III pantothenate kinase [Armatimonadota bacterium]